MSGFSVTDCALMARALRLAERGRYSAHPNPMVGCVIARDGEVVGEGFHLATGEAHAEVNAIREAGDDARGATAYVSLEPCAHHGRTAPCSDALIDAGVAAVVIAMEDPFEEVAGKGIAALEKAGIRVRTGLMQDAATALNAGYLSRVQNGRPFVRLKIAASIDGAIAMNNGQSQWISGVAARADVQRLRARSGAVMTGIGTVLADDPSLNVREAGLLPTGRQPLRVVLDTNLRMPVSSGMLVLDGDTLVYGCTLDNREALEEAGIEVIELERSKSGVSASAALDDLATRGVNDVLVEAGPALAGSLVADDLVDELVIYQAPHMMGSETRGMLGTPGWEQLTDRRELDIVDVRRVGTDTRITARFRATAN